MGIYQRLTSIGSAFKCLLRKSDTDAYLISLQQSGNHWLRMLLSQYFCDYYNLDFTIDSLDDVDKIIPHPRTDPEIDLKQAPTIRSDHHAFWFLYRNKKVVLLVRNLRKTLISAYEKINKINESFVSFEDFLKGDFKAVNYKYIDRDLYHRVRFLNRWSRYGFDNSTIHLVKFEKLKANTEQTLRNVLNFLDVPVDENSLDKAIQASKKEKMQELAKNSSLIHKKAISQKSSRDKKNLFNDKTEDYFLQYIEENLSNNYGYEYKKQLN